MPLIILRMKANPVLEISGSQKRKGKSLRVPYLHGNSVSDRHNISQFCLELTLPLFLAYLSMAKPSTFSKVHARSQEGAWVKHCFCTYRVNTGNWDAVRPPEKREDTLYYKSCQIFSGQGILFWTFRV